MNYKCERCNMPEDGKYYCNTCFDEYMESKSWYEGTFPIWRKNNPKPAAVGMRRCARTWCISMAAPNLSVCQECRVEWLNTQSDAIGLLDWAKAYPKCAPKPKVLWEMFCPSSGERSAFYPGTYSTAEKDAIVTAARLHCPRFNYEARQVKPTQWVVRNGAQTYIFYNKNEAHAEFEKLRAAITLEVNSAYHD